MEDNFLLTLKMFGNLTHTKSTIINEVQCSPTITAQIGKIEHNFNKKLYIMNVIRLTSYDLYYTH